MSKRGNTITEQNVDYALSLSYDNKESAIVDLDDNIICRTVMGKPVKPKTLGQKKYVDQIRERMIVFGIGPAGTGKTYLAMAMAITALKNNEVNKIILTRPAIEAGENLGFLPGDLQSKVDPYLRPLYDALYQMKMFLTRIGFGSKVIVTGDRTQKDLPRDQVSGLDVAMKVLKDVEDISFVFLDNNDVVRHPLVQKIVKAYEEYDKKMSNRNSNRNKSREK